MKKGLHWASIVRVSDYFRQQQCKQQVFQSSYDTFFEMLSVEHVSNIARKSFLEKFSSSRSSRSSVTSEERLRLAEFRGEEARPKAP